MKDLCRNTDKKQNVMTKKKNTISIVSAILISQREREESGKCLQCTCTLSSLECTHLIREIVTNFLVRNSI